MGVVFGGPGHRFTAVANYCITSVFIFMTSLVKNYRRYYLSNLSLFITVIYLLFK